MRPDAIRHHPDFQRRAYVLAHAADGDQPTPLGARQTHMFDTQELW